MAVVASRLAEQHLEDADIGAPRAALRLMRNFSKSKASCRNCW